MLRLPLVLSLIAGTTLLAAQPVVAPDALATVLQRAGERVQQFFARAQSIVCLEVVQLQPLNTSWNSDGLGRTVESELRLTWDPPKEGAPSTEAQTLRQLLKVNGQTPRKDDWNNCTEPEQQSQEPQPLSLLLPSQRAEYRFTLAGEDALDRRRAILIDFQRTKRPTVEASLIAGRDDCVSFDVDGGERGRVWIDAETYDVLRLDQRLGGLIDIPLPRAIKRRAGTVAFWTMERLDVTMRFKRVAFENPDETLVLPVTMSSMRIMRGAGIPRLRTLVEYKNYQRFLTSGRVVGE